VISVSLTSGGRELFPLNGSFPSASSVRVATYGGISFGGSAANQEILLSQAANNTLNCRGPTNLGAGLCISGLPLGLHTIKIVQAESEGASTRLTCSGFDIITPVHRQKSDRIPYQGTIEVAGLTLSDTRPIGPDPVRKERRKSYSISSNNTSNTLSITSPGIPVKGLSAGIHTAQGAIRISHSITFGSNANPGELWVTILVDGAQVGGPVGAAKGESGGSSTNSGMTIVPVSGGFHKVEIVAYVNSGIATMHTRSLIIEEL
jgi:hypothetical protein